MPVIKASAKITRQQWQNLKVSNISGVSDRELSQRYRIKEGTIRGARCADKEWSKAYTKVRLAIKSNKTLQESNQLAEVGDSTVASMEGIGTGTNLIVAQMGFKALQKFSKKAPALEEWSEASTAYNMVRKATGQDKEGTSVAVQFGAFWQGPENGPEEKPVVVVKAGES